MVDHAEPVVDRAIPGAIRSTSAFALRFGWVARETLLFPIVALYLITLVSALPREILSDTWFVILGGREVAHHGLPAHDTLTVWAHGRQWVDQQWLGQLFFYGLYALGGIKLAVFGHVAAAGSAFVGAICVARWRGATVRSIAWLAPPAIFLLIWGSWNARAQSLAFALFVLTAWLLVRDARSPSRAVFWTLPLLALWANIHGTAVTGALIVALAGITFGVQHRRQPARMWLPRAATLTFAPFACLFASPYAVNLPAYYHNVLSNSWFRDYVVEWRPTAPSFQTAPFYLLAFLAVWIVGRQPKRLVPYEQVLLAVTLLMGLQTLRSVIWFTYVALMLVPVALDGVLKPNMSALRFRLLNRALIATSVFGIALTLVAVGAKPASWFQRDYPAGALAAVARVEQSRPHVLVFANEQYSDWLLLRRPELAGRLAYDVRFEIVPRKQLDQLVDVRRRVEGWRKVIASFGLFVLKRDVEGDVARALLREPGTRAEYRGHGVIVISRPAQESNAK
jgi:hypothetical protein